MTVARTPVAIPRASLKKRGVEWYFKSSNESLEQTRRCRNEHFDLSTDLLLVDHILRVDFGHRQPCR
jgi:hypothetical protein